MKDDRCFCPVCKQSLKYGYTPHWDTKGRICIGHPRVVNPDPDEATEWPENNELD